MSESARYDISARTFRCPYRFTLSPPTIRDPYGTERFKYLSLSALPSSFTRNFHLKDTCLYNLAVPFPDIEDAFDEVWKTWYPRRNLQEIVDRNWNGIFCRAMKPKCGSSSVWVQEVVRFHEALVDVVDADEENWAAGRMLEDTFRRVFIVLDKENWEKDGVLIICREESVTEHGLGKYAVGEEEEEEEEEGGRLMDGGWVLYRKSLSEAVTGVICGPERRKAAAPVQEYYREKKFQL